MPMHLPSADALRRSAQRAGLSLDDGGLAMMRELAAGALAACERLDEVPGLRLPTRYPRTGARQVEPADDPFNAWSVRCDVPGADGGILAGKTVVVKDIVPVAGVPMAAGSPVLQGHTPDYDATIVTRVLDAGGTIVGVGATEDMCLSGASVSAVTGFVRNPHDPARSAGGSSSGVAALVASSACDVGIGADQGGSIRIPSSLCGVYGLKPTYGLVPYTGCIPIDVSIDYVGPMAGRAADVAALLEAIAGFDDGLDPRQRADLEPQRYTEMLRTSLEGLRIGLLAEGFGAGEADVDDTVRAATRHLQELGAGVVEVSAPLHRYSMDIHASVLLQGGSEFMLRGNGIGMPGKGFYDPALGAAAARGRAAQADLLFASVKYAAVVGGYLWETYGGAYYAKAQNLALRLRRQYDELFRSVDVIALPTTCVKAGLLPPPDASMAELTRVALDPSLISNTCAFNHTGHPALSVPVGPSEGLPVGLMLVARHGEDGALIGAAHALENDGGVLAPLPATAGAAVRQATAAGPASDQAPALVAP